MGPFTIHTSEPALFKTGVCIDWFTGASGMSTQVYQPSLKIDRVLVTDTPYCHPAEPKERPASARWNDEFPGSSAQRMSS